MNGEALPLFPGLCPKKNERPKFREKPLEKWTLQDFIAYVLFLFRKLGKENKLPVEAVATHLSVLYKGAKKQFGQDANAALKDLIDAYLPDPHVRTVVYLRYVADDFWSRWHPKPPEGWQW